MQVAGTELDAGAFATVVFCVRILEQSELFVERQRVFV